MHIRKYDFDYGRRKLMENAAAGAASAGVLASTWPLVSNGDDISKAYPEELTSIEANTKGKVKPGDKITADNVDHVKHLLEPIAYKQVKEMGRVITIVEGNRKAEDMFPPEYLEATVANQGKATLDANNNVVEKSTGGPWIGGNPFPEPKSGLECIANLTLSWGRHDYSQYAVIDTDINPDGSEAYHYEFVWSELNTTVRTGQDKVFRDFDDLLRLQSVWFTSPKEQAGSSFLSKWYYDQREFPELYGYLPLFKRVRQFPTNQRFEPLVPGITLHLSDAWAAGDPMLTWGNYKIVNREPHLVAIDGKNWGASVDPDNWVPPHHGGPQGKTFTDSYMELAPECIVYDAEPTGYPRAPVGKRRTWMDVRNAMIVSFITYDRRGEIWKTLQPSFGKKITTGPDGNEIKMTDKKGRTEWSWTWVMIHDIQANRMSRFNQGREVTGGFKTVFHADEDKVYEKYLTRSALTRLGAV